MGWLRRYLLRKRRSAAARLGRPVSAEVVYRSWVSVADEERAMRILGLDPDAFLQGSPDERTEMLAGLGDPGIAAGEELLRIVAENASDFLPLATQFDRRGAADFVAAVTAGFFARSLVS